MTTTVDRPATWGAVEAAQAGDMDAFGRIYQTYYDAVYRFIYYRARNPQAAQDLTSQTFLRALQSIGGVTWQGRDIGAWLFTIARNLVNDHHKSAAYRMSFPAGVIYEDDAVVRFDHMPDPADEITDRAIGDVLADAVSYLTNDQRTVIELRYYQQLSIKETAVVMGKDCGAIKALTFRAVGALRHLLDGIEVR